MDLFYRLCKKLDISAKFITDLDVLFQGNLRQSVSKDDRCKGYLQSNGLGSDSMVTIGHAEQEISNCLTALAPTDTTKLDASCKQFFEALLGTTDVSKRRYIFLIGLKLIRDDLEKLIQKSETIKLIEGIIQKSIKAFEQCAVYVLPNGELENYLAYLTGNPYQISEKAKNDGFEKERDYIIGSDNCNDIEERYRELIVILDKASKSKDVNFDEHLNYAIGEWIHKVQSAFIRGELKDKASIETNMRVEWKLYSRLFELLDFVPNSDDFICGIKLRPIVDLKERVAAFDRKSVPANFNLKSLGTSTNSV